MRTLLATIATVAGASIALLGVASRSQDLGAVAVDDREAYAVYSTLLPNEWTVRVAHATTLVIQKETATNRECMPSGKPLETDWRPVVDGFKAANAKVCAVLSGYDLGRPYVVVSSEDIRLTFKELPDDPMSGWTGFYRRYPESGGYLQVSGVGFDTPKLRAMVYMAHYCGNRCAGGMYHFLEKTNGTWREVTIPGVTQPIWAW